ncbi:rod shape-determining protein MreD [Sphingomonas sp. G124]|jgi:rod shape-determining protein MreD|uniref:Rod shape-determining protein MreD n=1 Tax=Sphingomonas cremea TaxID=2904799 RepID=A0A9X1U4K9_9SPHN|nr:rod shape-determining protein MreD [Sphingomonas cremea]MCF2514301.1 rod shape-determining protein MreD [Sphingomonas cremea]
MVRSALATQGSRLNQGPRTGADYIPAATVVFGSMISLLPIVSATGWWPDWGLLMLVAWRLLRADAWPAWWAAPLGFVNDMIVGNPIGLSVALWAAMMIAMDILDRRTQWRDYWIEWGIAALFIALAELAQWRFAALMGASVPLGVTAGPAILVGVLSFPVAAFLAARIDRWRLGR